MNIGDRVAVARGYDITHIGKIGKIVSRRRFPGASYYSILLDNGAIVRDIHFDNLDVLREKGAD